VTVLVTGATGFVGAHLVRALLARAQQVRCLVRPASRLDNLAGLEVERVTGDLCDGAALTAAVRGCEVVYHCAADYRLSADPAEIHRHNVEGSRNLLRAAAQAQVQRVVYTSSVGALGTEPDGRAATESTPVSLDDMVGPYKRSKFLAEREAEAWAHRGLPVIIVNPSTPIGDLDIKPTPTGQIVVDFLRRRMRAYVTTGLNFVDVRDVAVGHILAAERGLPGEKYILGHQNLTLKDLFDRLARISGIAAPRVRLPHWVPLALAHLEAPIARRLGRPPRVPLEGVRMSARMMFFDPSKAVRELGLPQSPIEPALERAVSWFRGRGYVPA
jgi:dihydroflavonol-4-reductase